MGASLLDNVQIQQAAKPNGNYSFQNLHLLERFFSILMRALHAHRDGSVIDRRQPERAPKTRNLGADAASRSIRRRL